MKVLHVFDHSIPLHSGYAFRSRNILLQQRKLGIETCHLTSPKQGKVTALEEDIDGLKFYRCDPLPAIYGGIKQQIAVTRALRTRLEQVVAIEKPDIIHAHSPALNGYAAVKVGRKFSLPVLYEVRAFWEDAAVDNGTAKEWGLRYRLTRGLESWVMKRAQQVTCICQGLRADIVARGIAEEKITVIPNAVNIDEFSVIKAKDQRLEQQLGLKGRAVVGFIGSFYALEGLELLLQGFAQAKQRWPELRCLIVGGGFEQDSLTALTQQLAIEQDVLFTGRVPHSDVDRYYSLIDLLIYPRRSKRITELVTPLKPLEAMAMGRLFAASSVGGHKELIEHGKTGFLFAPDSAEAVSEVITTALTLSVEEKQRLLNNGHAYVTDERNWANSVARYQDVYSKMVAKSCAY